MHAHSAILTAAFGALTLAVVDGAAIACSLNVGTPGGLRVNNITDPTTLASNVDLSTPATLTTILPLFSGVTVEVGVPTVVNPPAGYNYGTSTTQVAYNASVIGLIQLKDQPFTSSSTSFATGVLGALTVTIVMHNRVINTSGFPAGTYGTRTVVTCHP